MSINVFTYNDIFLVRGRVQKILKKKEENRQKKILKNEENGKRRLQGKSNNNSKQFYRLYIYKIF